MSVCTSMYEILSMNIQGVSLRGRHTPPATLAQEGKLVWSGQRFMIDCKCTLATWNAKSPAAMLQENSPDATRMSIPRMYLVSCCIYSRYVYIYIIYVSKLVTAELLSLGWRIGTDTGCAGLVLAGCRWVEKTVLNTHSEHQRGTCGWSDGK